MRRWCFYPPEVRAALERWEKKIHYVRAAWISIPGSPYRFYLGDGTIVDKTSVAINGVRLLPDEFQVVLSPGCAIEGDGNNVRVYQISWVRDLNPDHRRVRRRAPKRSA